LIHQDGESKVKRGWNTRDEIKGWEALALQRSFDGFSIAADRVCPTPQTSSSYLGKLQRKYGDLFQSNPHLYLAMH
jgi:hypothetical protein